MISLIHKIIASIFLLYSKVSYRRFYRRLKNPKKSQLKLKTKLKKAYLRSQRYQHNQTPFKQLEVKDYNDLIAEMPIEHSVSQTIICFVETSGSSGIKKRIPYTRALLSSFSTMFVLWAHDILKQVPFNSYKFYFSVTPQFGENSHDPTLKDDSDYLGPLLSFFLRPFIVSVKEVKTIQDTESFLMTLALTLVSERRLEIISIWSPTYLISLINFIEENKGEFLDHLGKGEYKGRTFKPCTLKSIGPKELFPGLRFVSAWGSSSSQRTFEELKSLLPLGVVLQPKGLLSTEAPMTMPLLGYSGGVPLIDEVYFEFFDDSGKRYHLWEIQEGIEYELVISQKGGLYRYPMKDIVKVIGFIEATPLLEFVGRSSQTSDLVGEKIHESEALNALTENAFALIASERSSRYYILANKSFVDKDMQAIEENLCKNPHYLNARKLNQLKALEVIRVEDPIGTIRFYQNQILKINLGDAKDISLIHRKGDHFLSFLRD